MLALMLAVMLATPPEHGSLFRAPGATLWYEVRGGGAAPPLVIVNGGPGVEHGYMLVSDVWNDIARRRPVVFYDQRGVGRSPVLAKGQSCTLVDQIDDLEALRRHLRIDRMDLLGHSWGGFLVMAYAARHPEHVGHLVIIDSAAPQWSDAMFLFKDVFPEVWDRMNSRGFGEQLGDTANIRANFSDYLGMLCYNTARRASMATGPQPMHVPAITNALINDIKQYDLGPELAKFTSFPTIVMTGRFDMNVAPSIAWHIHQGIPGSQFHVFEESGHLPFYEQPEEFTHVLEAFLDGHSASGAAR